MPITVTQSKETAMNPDDQPANEDNAEKAKQHEQWLEENRDAIQAYNRFIEEHDCFSEGLRSFQPTHGVPGVRS